MNLSTRGARLLVLAAAPAALLFMSWGGMMPGPTAAADPMSQASASDSSILSPGPSVGSVSFTASMVERMRGLVAPSQQVILAAPLDGVLAEVMVDGGDRVKAGDVLAVMDDDVQRVVMAASELAVQAREMELAESELQLEKAINLEQDLVASNWEVRRARLTRDIAEIQLKTAKENLRLERVRLERYQILAPFDGRVIRVDTDAGTSLRLGEPILSLVALDPLEAELYLPVDLYGQLEIGRTYHLEVSPAFRAVAEQLIGGKMLEGRLKSVDPLINSAAENFRCVFTIDNPEEALPAGFTVRLVWRGQ